MRSSRRKSSRRMRAGIRATVTTRATGSHSLRSGEGFDEIVRARLKLDPDDVLTLRAEQDARRDLRAAVCKRHRAMANAKPDSINLQYVAARCVDDDAQREQAFTASVREGAEQRLGGGGDGLHARGARSLERRDGGAQRGTPARAGDDGEIRARHDAPAADVESRRRCAGHGPRAAVGHAALLLVADRRARDCSPASTWRTTTSHAASSMPQ